MATALTAALGVVALAIAVSMPTPLLTVAELKRQHARWNGRVVKVVGLLEQESYEAEPLENAGWFHLSSWKFPEPDEHANDIPAIVWIAPDKEFDRKAKPLLGRRIVITVRFDGHCSEGRVICLGGYDVAVVPGAPIEIVR